MKNGKKNGKKNARVEKDACDERYVSGKDQKYGSFDKVLIVTTLPEEKTEVAYCKTTKLHEFLETQVRANTNSLVIIAPYDDVTSEVQKAITELRAIGIKVRIVFMLMRETEDV